MCMPDMPCKHAAHTMMRQQLLPADIIDMLRHHIINAIPATGAINFHDIVSGISKQFTMPTPEINVSSGVMWVMRVLPEELEHTHTRTPEPPIRSATKRSAHHVRTGLNIGRDFCELTQALSMSARHSRESAACTHDCVCMRASSFAMRSRHDWYWDYCQDLEMFRLVWRRLALNIYRKVSCILLYGKLQLYCVA